jgi:hypothetical protein
VDAGTDLGATVAALHPIDQGAAHMNLMAKKTGQEGASACIVDATAD